MDAGVASEENICVVQWPHGYRYIVVTGRQRKRQL